MAWTLERIKSIIIKSIPDSSVDAKVVRDSDGLSTILITITAPNIVGLQTRIQGVMEKLLDARVRVIVIKN